MITSNEQMRLAKMEAMCDQLRSEMSDVLERAYAIAVEERDEDLTENYLNRTQG